MNRKMYSIIVGVCLSTLVTNTFAMSLVGEDTNKPIEEVVIDSAQDKTILTKEKALALLQESQLLIELKTYMDACEVEELFLTDVAPMICRQLKLEPIYLPPENGFSNPYVGRLIVEGIWKDNGAPDTALTEEEGKRLFEKTEEYIHLKGEIDKPTQYKESETSYLQPIALGTLKKASTHLMHNDVSYALYSYNNTTYIPLSYLKALGCLIEGQENTLKIQLGGNVEPLLPKVVLENKPVSVNAQKVFIGNLLTYSLKVGEEILIPIYALNTYYELILQETSWNLFLRDSYTSKWIAMDENYIKNRSEEPLDVDLISLYWDGEKILKEPLHINQLQPNEEHPNLTQLYHLHKGKIYLTTIVERVTTPTESFELPHTLYGQTNESFLKTYAQKILDKEEAAKKAEEVKKAEELKKAEEAKEKAKEEEKLKREPFPSSIIIGTMKENSNGLKKGEKVEVISAEKDEYYNVKKDNKTIKIPWKSISIPKDPVVQKKRAIKGQIEEHINKKGFKSKTNYLVWTDLYRQRTYVFKKNGEKWVLYKDLLCSTGKNKTPTPRGVYSLRAYVPYFGVDKGYRCKNAVQIFDDYLYHSIIFDKTGTYLLEGKGILGQRASDGCIRFSEEESLWFYKTMPLGTTVWIN